MRAPIMVSSHRRHGTFHPVFTLMNLASCGRLCHVNPPSYVLRISRAPPPHCSHGTHHPWCLSPTWMVRSLVCQGDRPPDSVSTPIGVSRRSPAHLFISIRSSMDCTRWSCMSAGNPVTHHVLPRFFPGLDPTRDQP